MDFDKTPLTKGFNKEEYEKDLKKRQEDHLSNIGHKNHGQFQPCAHDSCSACIGTGVKKDGSMCIHHLYCSCPKCVSTVVSNVIIDAVKSTNKILEINIKEPSDN